MRAVRRLTSGRSIEELVAMRRQQQDAASSGSGGGGSGGGMLDAPPPITMDDLTDAVAATKPSVHRSDAARYEKWEQEFGASSGEEKRGRRG